MNTVTTHPSTTTFESLNLIRPILRALQEEQYQTPTPIQAEAIPHLLQGRDLLGCAQTGTGKTAAFALPVLQRLAESNTVPGPKGARALILAPTRELAVQIEESFRVYGRHLKLSRTLVYGGVKAFHQIRALKRGVDILVATPGRLLDLMEQRAVHLDKVEAFVLDEADRMLDMGFLPDVRRIHSALPQNRQTMLFSATLPEEVRRLIRTFLNDPVHVSVSPPSSTAKNIAQKILFVDKENKKALLEAILGDAQIERVLVFTRTKHGANQVAKRLNQTRIRAEAIHGNKSQPARLQALEKFRSGKTRVLVATDIVARGLDVDGITHVINYELPKEAESYVHRIGRTARAGAAGVALSFCDAGERPYLSRIEKEIRCTVDVDAEHPYHSANVAALGSPRNGRNGKFNRSQRGENGMHPRRNGNGSKRKPFRARSSRVR
ncbi:DEAD/DEAH box helicase [Nitrospina gracilis]|uniref:DEAD/DEAH box helicase n=1 Tax=Nitrospina gracilis TaxID=35801 RepID=UPI001F28C980|nr:DEAD/DEAH box helicase [Nitrospina gracilis]MCF8719889.1 ATP-dependent RNA helicase RhlE [Nitrospina gracilis Nb-211]